VSPGKKSDSSGGRALAYMYVPERRPLLVCVFSSTDEFRLGSFSINDVLFMRNMDVDWFSVEGCIYFQLSLPLSCG